MLGRLIFADLWAALLTKRESEVLQKMAIGKITSRMAEDMKVSKETIRSHIKNIYLKLTANSEAEALKKTSKNRLEKKRKAKRVAS